MIHRHLNFSCQFLGETALEGVQVFFFKSLQLFVTFFCRPQIILFFFILLFSVNAAAFFCHADGAGVLAMKESEPLGKGALFMIDFLIDRDNEVLFEALGFEV